MQGPAAGGGEYMVPTNVDACGSQLLPQALCRLHVIIIRAQQSHMAPSKMPTKRCSCEVGAFCRGKPQGGHVNDEGGGRKRGAISRKGRRSGSFLAIATNDATVAATVSLAPEYPRKVMGLIGWF
jgi:hypothetical protein